MGVLQLYHICKAAIILYLQYVYQQTHNIFGFNTYCTSKAALKPKYSYNSSYHAFYCVLYIVFCGMEVDQVNPELCHTICEHLTCPFSTTSTMTSVTWSFPYHCLSGERKHRKKQGEREDNLIPISIGTGRRKNDLTCSDRFWNNSQKCGMG